MNARMHAWRIVVLASLAGSLLLLLLWVNVASAQGGVEFDGSNDYVTFGQADDLGVSTFTIELWFMRTGTGATTSTGTGGVTAVPLLTKGRGEADGNNRDMNFFLGIRSSDNVLCADFEEGTGQTQPGLNHPVAGTTAIRNNAWYHAAATYDGTTWRLFLNGQLEATLVVGADRLPQSASIQHAALASALTSTGTPAGYFQGVIDEPRVWNVARDQNAIAADMTAELTSGTGLVGRWGLDDGSGTTAANSVGVSNGTLVGGPVWTTGSPFALEAALKLGSSNGYVTFGNPAELGLAQFTLETWFRRDGSGTAVTTGNGGITAVPLVTKGAAEVDGNNRDMNYFLGIRSSDNVLCADFEEGAGGSSPGLNHPVAGITPIVTGQWYHAAVTYDGTTWKLYLDGVLESELAVGEPVQSASIQPAGLGTSLKSDNSANGFFDGTIDEVRIWDYARSVESIDSLINEEITTPTTGLVGRWGLDEGAMNIAYGSAGTTVNGTVAGSGWSWTGGAPFDAVITPPAPPAAPSNLVATPLTHVRIDLSWSDESNNESGFEIERLGQGNPFALIATVGPNQTAYTDMPLEAEEAYCYRIRAVNAYGESDWSDVVCVETPAVGGIALDFDGTDAYVTFGDAAALDLPQFTLEAWIRRDGAGTTANTGSGGVLAVPLITKGVGEADGDNRDMNYFFGLREGDYVLCADFEEGPGGSSPGLNHPVIGTTPIPAGEWHHVAAAYDGMTWRLYLDGMPEAELYVGQPVQSASIQHAGLAAALNSSGSSSGRFDGVLDEVRVWNTARPLTEIQATVNDGIDTATTGLVARWALDEGLGATVDGSAGTSVSGTIAGSGYDWVSGAPFDVEINYPPHTPALVAPADGTVDVGLPPTLHVAVSDPEATSVNVTFYGRPVTETAGDPFSIVILPDTQYYTSEKNGGTAAIFQAQTQWVVDNREAWNIRYVCHVGDCAETGDTYPSEWANGWLAMSILEDSTLTGLAEGIPYDVTVGNHDQSPNGDATGTTTYFNQYFGQSHFAGRSYYGGNFGTNNDDHYTFFSGGGIDWIVISMEYDSAPDAPVQAWANDLLTTYADHRAIVNVHNLLGTGNPGSFSSQGQAVYDALKGHANLALMVCGHAPGEGRRVDTYNGNTVHTLMADYQSRSNGGNGWLRIMTFYPAENKVRVKTYSPTLDQFEADADSSSQFTLDVDLTPMAAWQEIASVNGVSSGDGASCVWNGLDFNTAYEWYAVVDDGNSSTSGPVWSFTTGDQVTAAGPGAVPDFALALVSRNPIQDAGRFAVSVPRRAHVRVSVYDVAGREVAILADRVFDEGVHTVSWDGAGVRGRLPSGVYFVRMSSVARNTVRKVVLVR